METIALFGKGGIGKSTVTSNMAVALAKQGRRVLVVGCDPKHDTTVSLTGGRQIPTVVDHPSFLGGSARTSGLIFKGRHGIDCVEAGGPEPGIGCAGRGISRMGEILQKAGVFDSKRYDVVFFDVLGDVVCGGFAVPLRRGFADKVYIVTSEEVMSLYAANNIAKAVRNYAANGAALCGLVANLRDPGADRGSVTRFAGLIGTRVAAFLPRDPVVRQAEYRQITVVEHAPDCELTARLQALAQEMSAPKPADLTLPSPLSDSDFHALSRKAFRGAARRRPRPAEEPLAPVVLAEAPKKERKAEAPPEEASEGWRTFLQEPAPARKLKKVTKDQGTKEWIALLAECGVKAGRGLLQPAPLGLAASGRALIEAASTVGRGPQAEQVWRKTLARLRAPWQDGVRQARDLRLGFIGEAPRLQALPALAMVKEMGFGLDFLVYAEKGAALAGSEGERHRVHRFPDQKTLWCLLQELDCPAVYSEYPFDARLTRAGKVPLPSSAFEGGAQGAQRTLERILDLCRWPFYRRYAEYL